MCGISGFISLKKEKAPSPEVILPINDELALRGPDGEGFLFGGESYSGIFNDTKSNRPDAFVTQRPSDRHFAFGHRRLSIIDLSTEAAQPMQDVTGRYFITFNGEIYNHAEIRTELEAKGYKFRTSHSDTEMMLNAYACWGPNCVEKFRGMFAFVIWDSVNDSFFIVRDRLGVKPFFYCIHDDVFYFASEFKALLRNKNIPHDIDYTALSDYLSFTSVPAPKTIFKSIKKLPAAHRIMIRNGEVSSPERYWSPLSAKLIEKNENQILEELIHHLQTSVKYRTIADVPIGCLLSGGVDSSTNLAFMSQNSSEPVNAFAVGFSNKNGYANEFYYAKMAADLFKANYYELELDSSHFSHFIREIVHLQDEPIADTANIPIYYIARKAKELGISVLLGGEGSDELLLGYEHWRLMYGFKKTLGKFPGGVGLATYRMLHSLPGLKNKRQFYRKWADRLSVNQPVFIGGTELRDENDKSSILSPEMKSLLKGYSSYEVVDRYYSEYKKLCKEERSYYDFMSFLDLNFRLPESLLARLDKMTMAASVEAREPFMDHILTEFCMSIPAELKVKNNTDKYLLKKGMEKFLPKEILYRPKQGFLVPLNNLLFEKDFLKNIANDINSCNNERKIFKQEYIDSILQQKKGAEVWNVLNISSWLNKSK
ncbi:MAG: asparagine synthase (glutamine-hydrolyzing) [Bacteroidetes bacterium]|nr:asparagine synthase (glutamine-hydrolyzing) [Bacteroidota bacterium]